MKTIRTENEEYLKTQIITYLGNKRGLLSEIDTILSQIGSKNLVSVDLFSGSGIVARLLKKYSKKIIVNDLELYSEIINNCYLSNKKNFDPFYYDNLLSYLVKAVYNNPIEGIISQNYAPKNDNLIQPGERVFYTHENAILIDSYRYYIDKLIPEDYKKYFLARLLVESSVHVNTSGVFKGFYKDKNTGIGKFGGTGENALSRITGKIQLSCPVLSNFETDYQVYRKDANELVKKLPYVDLVYIDPPYNQHPYGANYFMLNLIIQNVLPDKISDVAGIPTNWNRSNYNIKSKAYASLEDLVKNTNAKYILISYNNEGFISYDEIVNMLQKYGSVYEKDIKYNTFRGSRNLKNRSIYTKEFLFLLNKEK